MIIHAPRTKFQVAVELAKRDRFDIPVYGEPRTVDQFKAILNNEETEVHIACHLEGAGHPQHFTVRPGDIPAHHWAQVQDAYKEWRDNLPSDLDGFRSGEQG